MRRIFWGFYIKRFGIGPLHYISSRSDFGFKFAEIFVIEKRVGKNAYRYNFFQTFKKIYSESTVHPWLLFCQIDLLNSWFNSLKSGKSMLNFKKFE